jgi:uncharacterized protein (DUF302 family)
MVMKTQKILNLLFIAMLLNLTGCAGMMKCMMKNKMFVHYQSEFNFDKTYTMLHDSFNNATHWEILGEYDNQERYQSAGQLEKYKVIQVCNKQAAFKILKDDEQKFMGGLIPLKVCIYEKADKKVYISFMNTNMMGKMFKDKEISQIIKDATDEALSFINKVSHEK